MSNVHEIIKIEKIQTILETEHLNIPSYQRPYKWSYRNVMEMLQDIDEAIKGEIPYRIGTIILHDNMEANSKDIVDGQQRIITFLLLYIYLQGEKVKCSILENKFKNQIAQRNIKYNYEIIDKFFRAKDEEYKNKVLNAIKNQLEAVVITVTDISEAFQLFDSQNSRGRALDPHDLLKAYHLREMKDYPYEMRHAVTKWEAVNPSEIRILFDEYLFPIYKWTFNDKAHTFTAKDIDYYKGIEASSFYTYARRAGNAMPYFQLNEAFLAGNDFFEMVSHYLQLKKDIEFEIQNNKKFDYIKEIFEVYKRSGAGFKYCKQLFLCALLSYYDRFHNFEELAVKTLFDWAFMLRVDMQSLGFDSINKYAIGEQSNYTNNIPMFHIIYHARKHTEISALMINLEKKDKDITEKWQDLHKALEQGFKNQEEKGNE